MSKEETFRFTPAQANERKLAEADYKAEGFTFTEIPTTDGSGDIIVLFTPPHEEVAPVSSEATLITPSQPIPSSGNLRAPLILSALRLQL